MPLRAGIVGLPNVGKSTLFNALTLSAVEAANYPFATIEPNTAVVEVPDSRLDELVRIFKSQKRIATTLEITDIAGLVRGASKGEGLGNQFLAAIREVDAIIHVVRCFDDADIVHVEGRVDPINDINIIDLELVMSDLDSVKKRIDRVEKKATVTKDKDAVHEYTILKKLQAGLDNLIPARNIELTKQEYDYATHNFFLLSLKPVIYVANIGEKNLLGTVNEHIDKLTDLVGKENVVTISARFEEEICRLSPEEKDLLLEEFGVESSGLEQLIKIIYKRLDLKTFFTAGEKESRAWTFKEGMSAPECAGIIHTDFQKGFIKAEVFSFQDLISCGGSEQSVKEHGKLRLEGKEYKQKDGDIVHYRFANV